MRIKLVRGGPPWAPPRPAVAAGVALIALGLLVAALSRGTRGPVICPFRAVTGLPCPTCGMVRATGQVLSGEFQAAFRTNPLDAASLLFGAPIALALFVLNRALGWRLHLSLSRREKITVGVVAAVAAAANWIYVLRSGI